jgi:hypothetical protein
MEERMKKKEIPNRRPCLTEDVGMGLTVTVSYHPETGEAVEVFMTGRGKASDNPMQDALYNMGVKASNLMQMIDEPDEPSQLQAE